MRKAPDMVVNYKQIPTTKAVLDYIMAGPHCRDCADGDGVCASTGLPCDPVQARKAIRYVLVRVNYGIANGYLKP